MKKIISVFAMTLMLTFGFVISYAYSDTDEKSIFNKRIGYDIYLDNGEEYPTVIKEVEVVGFEYIEEKLFLVIKSQGFNIRDVEGYVLFDSVIAILPKSSFKLRKELKASVTY